MQDFLADDIAADYRPSSQLPPAYRPPRDVVVCRYFCAMIEAAVDAGDTFACIVLCYWSYAVCGNRGSA